MTSEAFENLITLETRLTLRSFTLAILIKVSSSAFALCLSLTKVPTKLNSFIIFRMPMTIISTVAK